MSRDFSENPFAPPETLDPLAPKPVAHNLKRIVRSQRFLIYSLVASLLLWLVAILFGMVPASVGFLFSIAFWALLVIAYIARIASVASLARAVGYGPARRYAYLFIMCLGFIPFVTLLGWLVMVVVNQRATQILKSVGIPVGLLGVASKNESLIPVAQERL